MRKTITLFLILLFFITNAFSQGETCATALTVTPGTYTADGPSSGNGAANNCYADATHADWYSFTPASDSYISISSCGGGADTRLSVYEGSCGTLVCVANSDDFCDLGNGNAYAAEISAISVTAGTTYYIEWDNRWSTSGFDWSLEELTCPPPSAQTVSGISSNNADLQWIESGSATTWNIEWGPKGFTQGAGTMISGTTTNPHSLTGLSENTEYDWFVQADCGSGDVSIWVGPNTFKTFCSTTVTAPYSDSFEAQTPTTNATWSNCWTTYPTGISNRFRWDIDAAGSTPSPNTGPDTGAHSGSNYAYTEASFGTTGDIVELYSPVIDISGLATPALTFYYHMYGAYMGTLHIDIYDGATWNNDEATIVGEQQSSGSNAWLPQFVDLSAYSGNIQIRFRGERGADYRGDICIDDVSVDEAPSCPAPSAPLVTEISSTSGKLGWTESGSATSWNIEWGSTGFTQGTGTTISGITTNPYTLTGLTEGSAYDWYVQADCGGGEMSTWVGPITFSTICVTKIAPFSDSFEDQTPNFNATWNSCWVASPAGTTSSYRWDIDGSGSTPSSGTGPDGGANTGSNYAYTEATSGSTGSVAGLYSPYIDISGLTTPTLLFYYHMYGSYMGTLHVDIWDGTAWNYDVATISGQQQTSGGGDWIPELVDLSSFTGTILVYFRAERGADYTSDICIDDFSIDEPPSCTPPTTQVVSNLNSNSVDLEWTEIGSANTWNIEWGPTGFSRGTGTTITGTTSNPYNLTGLTGETTYDWYVQSDCGSGDLSFWTGPHTFYTPPGPHSIPFVEDFESGFSFFDNATGNPENWVLNTSIYHGGVQSAFNINSYQSENILHETGVIDLSAISYPFLTFWHIAALTAYYDEGYIDISVDGGLSYSALPAESYQGSAAGYKTNGHFNQDDYPEWHARDFDYQQPNNTWWVKEIFDLSAYTSNNVRLRFRIGGSGIGYGWYLDDIEVDESTCPPPTAQTTTNITSNSADFGWTENGTATNWSVEYGHEGFVHGSGTIITGVSANPYNITGLTSGVTYDWYVRAECGANDDSFWFGPFTFTTACNEGTIPYLESFDHITAPDLPPCMITENSNNDATEWISQNYSLIGDGGNSAIIGYSSTPKDDWLFTNGIELTGGVEYILNAVYSGPSNLEPDDVEKLEVYWGNSPTSTDMINGPIHYNNNIVYDGYYDYIASTFTPTSSGTYYIGFHAFSDADQSSLELDNISIVENVSQTTWNGSVSEEWKNPSNWSNGIPGSQTDVIIPPGASHYPVILYNPVYCKNIELQSSSAGDGAIIGETKILEFGNWTIQRYLTDGAWHDITASIQGQKVNSLYQGPGGPDVWLRTYNEPTNTRTYITDLDTDMLAGEGFEVWVESGAREDITIELVGEPNIFNLGLTTTSTPSLSYTTGSPQSDYGYNMVGNPSVSPLSWDLQYWNYLSGIYYMQDVSPTVWVWDHAAGNWKDRVAGVGSLTDGVIPMGQGFFIQTTGPDPYIYIPHSCRVYSSQDYYKRIEKIEQLNLDLVTLKVENGLRNDELNVVFKENATELFDNDYDGRKLFSIVDEAPAIYSYQNEESLSTNALPPIGDETRKIDMHFIAGETDDYKIQAEISNLENVRVFLEDKFLGEFIDLRSSPEYNFSANTSDDDDRFVLHFNPVITEVGESVNENLINVYAYDDKICIKSHGITANERKQVWVYDLSGRIALNKLIPASGFTTIPVTHLKGYFVVKVLSESGFKTDKIYIK